ncbi:MAG: AAA family ATPase [Gammaproteobacteria bacterium]|nr:AAA family ATPase [Gammaproteobacteria bacterium]
MIPRQIADSMQNAFHKYPVITVTGPRQSGKTTLCRYIFEGRQIVYKIHGYLIISFMEEMMKRITLLATALLTINFGGGGQ